MMKRSFHISALFGMLAFIPVALLCQGCDEIDSDLLSRIEYSDVPVVFGSYEDGIVIGSSEETKAVTETTTERVNTTNKTGVFKFCAVYLYGSGETSSWENVIAKNTSGVFKPVDSPDLVVWPQSGKFNFYAVWPSSYTINGNYPDYSINCGSSTTAFNCTDDVVIARNCGISLASTGGTGQVPITFNHIFAYLYQVNAKVVATNIASDAITATISSLKITAVECGTYHIYNDEGTSLKGHWNIAGTQSRNIISSSKSVTSTQSKISDDNFSLIPSSDGKYTFTITYSLQRAGTTYATYTDMTFTVNLEMGKKTTVNLELKEDGTMRVSKITGEFFENLSHETISE